MTIITNKSVSRRKVLKNAAVAGASVLAAPAFIKNALSSSGEINVMMWSDYLPEEFKEAFTKETGIAINHTGIGSNEEIINKLRATRGRGFDLVSPTNMRAQQWEPLNLLQAFDMNKVPIDRVNASMAKVGETDWNFGGKGSHWVPQLWGTEAIAWRTDKWTPEGGIPSYGDLWVEGRDNEMMGRPHSMMLGAGLYMETIGELAPGDVVRAYKSEDDMKDVWSKITQFCIDRKKNVKKFWNDADGQKNGLMQEDVIRGQTWDGPILALKSEGNPVQYQAPKEGALAWVDGIAMPVGAKNIDQVYAFLEFSFRPEFGGLTANLTGYNSAVIGADAHLTETSKKNFAEAYPGDALDNLFAWPAEPTWYAQLRTEFQDKFVAS
ncbi:extracellular solute-binding protein [Kiloniella laminariae]|uniref:Extracellular solute-binding protein n=1 Tax=Kiloniella laminariae TaxID=454162 RepID=A0ABT4LMY6_9PROT|nr:extracellular solute-binding protein [Kiloniella laminariae]MCZ4282487.1 extracellular solute-binding protein [Kiloniella laminariae]